MTLMLDTAKVPSLGSVSCPDKAGRVRPLVGSGPVAGVGHQDSAERSAVWGRHAGLGAATGRLVCRMITVIFEALIPGISLTASP